MRKCVRTRMLFLECWKAGSGNHDIEFDFSLDKNVVELMPCESRIKDQLFVKFSLSGSSQVISVSSSVVKQALNIKEK